MIVDVITKNGIENVETVIAERDYFKAEMDERVNHPPHYTQHPSGIECIQVTEHMNFCLGNAVKYIWRHADKGNSLEDLKKARWYLDREIARIERQSLEKV